MRVLALENFPDRIAVGLDDHAAFDYLGGLRHVALKNHVLVPRRKILVSTGDARFGHVGETSGYHPGRFAAMRRDTETNPYKRRSRT